MRTGISHSFYTRKSELRWHALLRPVAFMATLLTVHVDIALAGDKTNTPIYIEPNGDVYLGIEHGDRSRRNPGYVVPPPAPPSSTSMQDRQKPSRRQEPASNSTSDVVQPAAPAVPASPRAPASPQAPGVPRGSADR